MACALGIEQNCSECRMCSNTNKNPNTNDVEKSMSKLEKEVEFLQKQYNITNSQANCYIHNFGNSNICRFENIRCTRFDKCSEIHNTEKELNNKYYKHTLTEQNIKGLRNCICYCVVITREAMKEAEFRNIKVVQVKNTQTLLALEREHRNNTRKG